MSARGIRNNNPGNIRRSADKWQGLAKFQKDPDFFTFESPLWGLRAIARILINYYDKYDCDTVVKIVSRWAPETENDTRAYAHFVAQRLSVGIHTEINPTEYKTLFVLVDSIVGFECGKHPYSKEQMDEALRLAGVVQQREESASAAVAKDPKVIMATAATALASAQAAVSSISGIWDDLAQILDPRFLIWAMALGTAVAVGYFVWKKLSLRKAGLQ